MRSMNHQFVEFSDQVKKRYVKTRLEPITGWRLNPRNAVNPNDRLDFLLATPESSLNIEAYSDGQPTTHKTIGFSYDDEVLELYTDTEVRAFERMNRLLIENGLLVEFSENAPEINKANALTDIEIQRIAATKSVSALKNRLSTITSIETLELIKTAMSNIDTTTMAAIRAVNERINEVNKS